MEVGPSGVDPQDLQDIISAKHARITSYLRKCSQVWLLIVADAAHISSIGDIDDSVRDYEYTSGFDRIIFYDAFNKKVVLIKE
ncbi:MAG: hypothetical protein JO316_04615 [Abitibacteriaceae bacterium]|nr:hypothetical protein [Abditibacteriaceae bacterium]